jgi:isopropylmalate/homocitrate/citramalate synthase
MADWVTLNTSPLNFMEEVRRETHLPGKVFLHDNTLRDGEQFAGVEFTKDEKIRIAQTLSDYGVHRIEVMPAVSREDMETTAHLNAMRLSAEIVGFCRSVQEDVQKAADAGCKSVVIEIVSHPPVLQALGWSFETATGKMIEISHFAKSKGLRVTAMFVLVTQAPLEFSRKFIQKIIAEAAIDALCIPDTHGTCMPQAIYHYVRMLKSWTEKPVEIHPHNHFGMGAACALAGVMAGAEVVHACVNGLGEGGGNAPLEAVAMDLQLALGIETGIRLEKTYDLCRLVSEISRIPLQANWPLAGERVFDGESGVYVDIVTKLAKAGLAIPKDHDVPAILGRSRRIVLGKMSGRTSIRVKMEQLGLPAPDEQQVTDLLERVKNRSVEIHDVVGDEEFRRMVAALMPTVAAR